METKPKTVFSTVDEYIGMQPAAAREGLQQLRETIRKAAPSAEETISYQMPAFRLHGMLVYFAAFSGHFGFYPMPATIEWFKDKLKGYKLSKGTIQFPFDQPLPLKLVEEIVKFRVKENLENQAIKETAKNKKAKK
jgi:uncharacterized protein YdhG (YjbR/CyaY superfamily)